MRQKVIKGYKFLRDDMMSKNGSIEKWELGVWKKHDRALELCASGFHACESPLKALNYAYGNRLFIVEARGKMLHEKGDKFCAKEMRMIREVEDVKRICVAFAVWCARRSLKHFEKKYPDDKRPRQAIEVAENWLKEPTKKNGSAARSAESAAGSAARSAESAARSAAWSAESAAESAAWSAESAAWSAESAARSAARSAESAARSAESAAGSAARSAAWSAAWSAARSAAEKKLLSLIRTQLRKQERGD